jgi:hypothetical protein
MESVDNMMVSEDGGIGRKRTHNAVVQPARRDGGANELAGRQGGAEGEECFERPVSSVSSPSRGHATPMRSTSLEATDAESLQILQRGYKQGYRTLSRTSSLDDREAVFAGQAKMHKWSVPVSRAATCECAFASAPRARVSALLRAFRRTCHFALRPVVLKFVVPSFQLPPVVARYIRALQLENRTPGFSMGDQDQGSRVETLAHPSVNCM